MAGEANLLLLQADPGLAPASKKFYLQEWILLNIVCGSKLHVHAVVISISSQYWQMAKSAGQIMFKVLRFRLKFRVLNADTVT